MDDLPSASPNGAAPLPKAQRLSVDEEAQLMGRGRGRHLAGMIAGVVIVALIGIAVVQNIGRTNAYDTAASETARIRQDHFDGFFGCALVGTRPTALSARRIQSELESLGEDLGKSYERTLRACQREMSALSTSVQALQVPDEVTQEHEVLAAATNALVEVNAEYLRYLSKDGPAYDHVSAMPLLERFGVAWAEYDTADASLRLKLRERL